MAFFNFFRFMEMRILSAQIKVVDVTFHDYILIHPNHLMVALVFGPKMKLCHSNVMTIVTKPSNVNVNLIKFLIWSMETGMYPFFQIHNRPENIKKSRPKKTS